jgi:hypothetical protein
MINLMYYDFIGFDLSISFDDEIMVVLSNNKVKI